ncbi:MAG: serine/threonine-protein phosphatase [Anaerolineales bacterium]|nr:serine/threonine-protein phosphatase [Anaerolineales bacterium]
MIPAEKAHLGIAAGSHPGRKGKNNEDQFAVAAFTLNQPQATPVVFAIVADGIGGHRAGEVASNIAVEMICDAVSVSNASQPLAIMEAAMIRASQTIQAQGSNSETLFGMGTTAVCAWVIGGQLYSAHVGNSRLYLLRGRKLIQLNVDHTWVREAVDAGALTTEQARAHPHANIIRRYLGSETTPEVDLRIRTDRNSQAEKENQGFRLRSGDRLLLCSDGLNDMVNDQEIGALLAQPDLNKTADDLITAANQAGGKDNITVVILEMPHKRGLGVIRENFRHISPQLAISYAGLTLMGIAIISALALYLVQIFKR